MKAFPYAREDAVLDGIALRIKGDEAAFDPDRERIDVDPPESGEAFELEANIVVDLPAIVNKPLVEAGRPISLLAIARCRETRWSSTIGEWQLDVTKDAAESKPAVLNLDPERISGSCRIVFCLCVASEQEVRMPAFARRKWNILAEKRFSLLMSGAGGSITEWVSFKERNLPPGLWNIKIPSDLSDPAIELKILLNKDNESFQRLMSSTSAGRERLQLGHTMMRRLIRAEFVRSVVTHAFSLPDSELPSEHEDCEGKCWGAAFSMCKLVFGEDWNAEDDIAAFKSLRAFYSSKLNRVDTMIQAFARLPQTLDLSRALNPTGAI